MQRFAVGACAALVSWSAATGSPIDYLSHSGVMNAGGVHPLIPSSGMTLPLSDLTDVHETLVFSESVPPNGYQASAELMSSLGPNHITLFGVTTARVQGCDPFRDLGCHASSGIDLTIAFELSVASQASMDVDGYDPAPSPPFASNGPFVNLEHSTLGFVLQFTPFGDVAIPECGSLSEEECFALIGVFPGGGEGVLPAGAYELTFELDARDPGSAPCNVGCYEAGGTLSLQIVPEPATGALLGLGLAALASHGGARRRRRPARGVRNG